MKNLLMIVAISGLLLTGCSQSQGMDKSDVRDVVKIPAMLTASMAPKNQDDVTQKITDLFVDCMYHYKSENKVDMKGVPAYVGVMNDFFDSKSKSINKALKEGPRAFVQLLKKSNLTDKINDNKKAKTGKKNFNSWVKQATNTKYCKDKRKTLAKQFSSKS